jgi:multiple sugar transport system substrate-binding protein
MTKLARKFTVLLLVMMALVVAQPIVRAQSPVELQLMGWSSSDAENKRLQEIVDTFNKANPDIKVTLNQVPEYDTALTKALVSGNPPDVFYVDSFRFLDYVTTDALMPIGDKLENPDDFYPSLKAAFTYNGQFYCPPKDFSTLALQVNTDMLNAAGLKAPTSWDEIRDAAKALTTDKVAGIVLPADFARWIAFLYASGGSVTDETYSKMTINSPEATEALKFYTDLYLEGYAKTPADLGAGWPGEAFGKGVAAMAVEGNWMVPFLKDNYPDVKYDVVELPAGKGGKATMAFTVCYAVPANAKNPDASIKLVNYLTGAEGMKAWTDLGLAMPTRQSLREGWLKAFPDLEPFLAGAEYAHKWQFVPGFQQVLDKVNEQIQLIFAGNQLPEDALKEIETVGTEILNKAATPAAK